MISNIFKNLPIDILNQIFKYYGKIKYRKNHFVNIIHLYDFRYTIIEPVIQYKQKIIDEMDIIKICLLYKEETVYKKYKKNHFYFEIEFVNLPGTCLSYDYYYFNDKNFEICFNDDRINSGWLEYKIIID